MHMCEALISAYEATNEIKYLTRAEIIARTLTTKLASETKDFVWEHYSVNWKVIFL
jgi:mannose/cellobiose epimerase-like protein (N-acyl-D-glucosamine 2-epimerase family)